MLRDLRYFQTSGGGVSWRSSDMERVTVFQFAKDKPLEALLVHRIRLRAYELYEQRGRHEGRALEDWLRAEREVLSRVNLRTSIDARVG